MGVIAASGFWLIIFSLPILIPDRVSRAIFSYLDISNPPRPADYLLVPSGNLFHRLPAAITLLSEHFGDTLILTVTEPSRWRKEARQYTDEDITEGPMVLRLLRSRGVGDTQVIFLGESRSTWQDAEMFSEFLSRRPTARALAISDGYHLRRLRFSIHRVDPMVSGRIGFVSSSSYADFAKRGGEPSDLYQVIFKEWIKLVFYALGRA